MIKVGWSCSEREVDAFKFVDGGKHKAKRIKFVEAEFQLSTKIRQIPK